MVVAVVVAMMDVRWAVGIRHGGRGIVTHSES